ncbi:ATP-grasp domain-containing protein [Gracilimonas mengyeensis]|uniref:RimK-like ATP-grasp domain-containing protein n=1 Tax=Gracilimonas mengyeensis TaxID=1302730 RepID=A0A521ES34_9BACT|nr:ATP-grasp domain-containing protein [Gracilimonas mengyeensis]SMO86702.1 RimK-like ATP-grasp domain-containing protein [Gracilimonas mengyeensis]
MIVLFGIPSQPSLTYIISAFEKEKVTPVVINQRELPYARLEASVYDGVFSGVLKTQSQTVSLDTARSVYSRFMDYRYLPAVENKSNDHPLAVHTQQIHSQLSVWLATTQALVVNPADGISTNYSKPYQLQKIQEAGFSIPDTLVTSDPEEVQRFKEGQGEVIFKSISSIRSIVKKLKAEDMERLKHILWCPVQFQQYIPGDNIRVHVVGNQCFATRITTSATVDYRYSSSNDDPVFSPMKLPDEVEEKCVKLTKALGLVISGIDFKHHPDGAYYCLEVNPTPAFSYYESRTDQPISTAIAQLLMEV